MNPSPGSIKASTDFQNKNKLKTFPFHQIMKSLTCSSSSSSCSSNSTFHFSSSHHFHPNNHRSVSFPLSQLPSLHFISHHIHPVQSSPHSSQAGLQLTETAGNGNCESRTVRVRFLLKKECSFGEQFAIVGDDPNLGFWDPDNAIPLTWSDDHVWSLLLDLPIGKSIRFKFVLKEISGSVIWQPGPDRILETWDTESTIVVSEDWEDSTSRKLLEEEEEDVVSTEDVEPDVNSEKQLVAEHFVNEDASDVKEEKLIVDVESNSEKEPLTSSVEKPVISDAVESPEDIADDVITSNDELSVNENHRASNKEAVTFQKILQNNGRTPNVVISESEDDEEDAMVEEGDPVLVPGLPVDCNQAKVDCQGEENKVRANEVESHSSPELEEKHDSQMIEVQKAKTNEESNKVIENDTQRGRTTIQRLLANLGLL